jgi:hypothetical protein
MAATHGRSKSKTVGVRELRQNLSRYLERVKEGDDPYYLKLAEDYGATVPTGNLLDAIKNLPPLETPAPAGTTDAFLDESRRGEFGPR